MFKKVLFTIVLFSVPCTSWAFNDADIVKAGAGESKKMFSDKYEKAISKPEQRDIQPELESLVKKASKGQAVLKSYFDGPEGLIGVILEGISPNGEHIYAWVTKDLNHLIIGQVYGRDGEENTALARKIMESDQREKMSFKDQKKALVHSGHIKQYPDLKDTGDNLYVFIDINCPYSELFFNEVQEDDTFLEKGIQINWVLIGLSEGDIQRASYLAAKENLNTLKESFEVPWDNEKKVEDSSYLESIRLNNYLLYSIVEDPSVPTMMWVDSENNEVVTHAGAPEKEDFDVLIDYIF